MEYIWAPWRIQYIQMEKPEGCILCEKPKEDNDVANYILYRRKQNFIILNSYPYNPGHLMVAPYRHVGELEGLSDKELLELMSLTSMAIKAIKREMQPQGFNLGVNLGKAAGAGFDQHVHMHVVPRWQGDTNFMPVVGESKVMPETVEGTYDRLLKGFGEHTGLDNTQ